MKMKMRVQKKAAQKKAKHLSRHLNHLVESAAERSSVSLEDNKVPN
jgi:hypothetical protein